MPKTEPVTLVADNPPVLNPEAARILLDILIDAYERKCRLENRPVQFPRIANLPTPGDHENDLLTVPELCSILKITPATIYGMRYQRKGPPAIKVGRQLRFKRADVDAWLEIQKEPQSRKP